MLNLFYFFFVKLRCLYCERIFKSAHVLRQHMKKKNHLGISGDNPAYDRFYIVNYVEKDVASASADDDDANERKSKRSTNSAAQKQQQQSASGDKEQVGGGRGGGGEVEGDDDDALPATAEELAAQLRAEAAAAAAAAKGEHAETLPLQADDVEEWNEWVDVSDAEEKVKQEIFIF